MTRWPATSACARHYNEKIREIRGGKGYGYRRGLLSSTLRLTRSMSPEIADTVAECKAMIGHQGPVEVYVTPEHQFNATCYREVKGPTVLTLLKSSACSRRLLRPSCASSSVTSSS